MIDDLLIDVAIDDRFIGAMNKSLKPCNDDPMNKSILKSSISDLTMGQG
jgi:hypothetical protein